MARSFNIAGLARRPEVPVERRPPRPVAPAARARQPAFGLRRASAWFGVLGMLALTAPGCEWLYDDLEFDTRAAPIFRARRVVTPPDLGAQPRLRVMAWNVKYAAARAPFWFDCWGDQVVLEHTAVQRNLDALAALVREVDPDVLVVEEIEVNSRRSAYVDQVAGLLDRTDLNYAAYFQTWDSRYIPSEGLGRMDLGLAIFSKYPIDAAESVRQADRTDQDAVTRAFYIHRVVGRAEVRVRADLPVAVYAVHTEAYDLDGTKQRQIEQIYDLLAAETLPWVVGGDFNELPPVAVRREGFPDERTAPVCGADFEQPPYTPEVMAPFFADFAPWIALDAFGATEDTQRRYFTHSVLGPDEVNEAGAPGFWNRTLDYLFADGRTAWVPGASDVLQVAGQRVGDTDLVLQSDPLRLSDHAPVVGVWAVRP